MSAPVKRKAWLDALLAAQGAPYVWGGHGSTLWTPQGLKAHPWQGDVFDCAGLVTTTLHRCGGPDWRATHNAQTLFDVCDPAPLHNRPLNLLFYGSHEKAIEHVAIVVGCSACEGAVMMLKLEAAGGGRGNVEPQRDPMGLARVMVRRENRRDFVGERSLPASVLDPAV